MRVEGPAALDAAPFDVTLLLVETDAALALSLGTNPAITVDTRRPCGTALSGEARGG